MCTVRTQLIFELIATTKHGFPWHLFNIIILPKKKHFSQDMRFKKLKLPDSGQSGLVCKGTATKAGWQPEYRTHVTEKN